MADPYAASRKAGERIESLFGHPVADLASGAEPGTILYGLLCSYDEIRLADHAIVHQAEALNRRTQPGHAMTAEDAPHILDAARRLAHYVSVRDAHAQALGHVLQGLHRAPATEPPPSTASAPAPAVPASSPLPATAPSAARSR